MRISPRLRLATIAIGCFCLLGFGAILQQWEHIEPCPMCIMQRYAFLIIGVIALVGAVHNPARIGQRIYAGLLVIAAGIGLGIGARQSWLQWFPPKFLECGPDLEYLLNSFPLGQALPKIFAGSGDCSAVDWTFLGLSIANWAVLCFTAIIIIALTLIFQRRATDN
ncbi:MAG: disulfide bond formation protein B [Betaproteobacteria bacterium]|nr:disulfide bond formation protein B [Betaproteobacteria bacterium]